MRELKRQRVCVVGGTAWIGLAIAHRARLASAAVTIVGRYLAKVRALASEIGVDLSLGGG